MYLSLCICHLNPCKAGWEGVLVKDVVVDPRVPSVLARDACL